MLSVWSAPLHKRRAVPRIILLETFDVPVVLEHSRHFLNFMAKLGYGRENIALLKAQGDPTRARKLLEKEIQRARPAVIVANATLAAKVAYTVAKPLKIPVVFFVVSDPVGAGLVQQVGVPSHDLVSGLVHSVPRETKIEMIMRILKPLGLTRPVRFGFVHSSYPSALGDLNMLRAAARNRGDLVFVDYEIPYDEKAFDVGQTMHQLVQGIAALEDRVDYWWIAQDPVAELDVFVRTLMTHSKHPVICGTNESNTKGGALVHITAHAQTGARETAEMVDAIVKGADVGTLPVHSPSKIEFGVNLSTAERTGLAIPSDLLKLAGGRLFR
jgi:putative ABC transport system substrate-binding protein